MGLFSRTKTYVGSATFPLSTGDHTFLTDAVRHAILSEQDIVGHLSVTNLTSSGVRMGRFHRAAEQYAPHLIPTASLTATAVSTDVVTSIIAAETGKNITIDFIEVEVPTTEQASERYLYETYGYTALTTPLPTSPPELVTQQEELVAAYLETSLGTVDAEKTGVAAEESQPVVLTTEVVVDGLVTTTTTVTRNAVATVDTASVTATPTLTTVLSAFTVIAPGVDYTFTGTSLVTVERQFTGTLVGTLDTEVVTATDDGEGNVTTTTTSSSEDYTELAAVFTRSTLHEDTLTWFTQNSFAEELSAITYKARYYYTAGGDNTVYAQWFYAAGTGTYPELDFAGTDFEGGFFPIVPIRRDNKDLTDPAERDNAEYTTAKRLLNTLPLDMDQLATTLNENPDVGQMDHAVLLCGVSLRTEEQYGIRYLYEAFSALEAVSAVKESNYLTWNAGGKRTPPPQNRLHFQEGVLNIEIAYLYIKRSIVTGTVGKVGECTKSITLNADGSQNIPIPEEAGITFTWDRNVLTLRKQSSATQYEQLEIHGLLHTNNVYKLRNSYLTVETNLHDVLNDSDSDAFIIPLHKTLFDSFSLVDRTHLTIDSLHLVVNSIERVKLKWYQTGLFRFVVTALAMWWGGPELAAQISAATAAGVMGVLQLAGTALLLAEAFQLVVKAIGGEAALILAAVAMAAGIVINMELGLTGLETLITAENLMFAANGLLSAVETVAQEGMEAVTAASDVFWDEAKKLSEQLETMQEDLDPAYLNPLIFLHQRKQLNPSENPSDFYDRTIHSGNIGVKALDAIATYVDRQLQLPKPRSYFM